MSTKQYLYKVSILNRTNSHPLEAISYYSGESQYAPGSNKSYVSNSQDNVIWRNLATPDKNNHQKYQNLPHFLQFRSPKNDIISNARNMLWARVFEREVRADAQFARLFEVLIPGYFTKDMSIDAMNKFSSILVDEGMIADCSIHSRNSKEGGTSLLEAAKNNFQEEKQHFSIDYTGFLMCTLRDYENGIFVNKNRTWNDRQKMENWRKEWVKILAEIVHNSDPENKRIWEEKLTIYSEYEEIKKDLYKASKPQAKIAS